MDLIRACGPYTYPIRHHVVGLPGTGFEPYPVVVALLDEFEYEERQVYGLSFMIPPFDPEGQPAVQVVNVVPMRDGIGRRRRCFRAREPGGPQWTETLYLAPGSDRFLSRHALQVTFRAYPPRPLGLNVPWDQVPGQLVNEIAQLVREARELLRQFPGSQAQKQAREEAQRRSTRGLRAARRRWLSLRQKAVAHLWGMCGWEPEQLAQLFGVHERSIKRDLTAARKLGDAPRRRVGRLAPQLLEHAKRLFADCRALSSVIWQSYDTILWHHDHEMWAYAICARLLTDEVKLTEMIARLGEAQPVTFAHWRRATKLDGMVDPQLLEAAERLITDHIQARTQERPAGQARS
jgi:hypothetical protein